ncbi:DinB family protein [Niabella terrae]
MSTTITKERPLISADELLNNWQGHRNLTRRVIEAFPEKALFEHTVGGMRPFADMAKELIVIARDGLKQVVTDVADPFDDSSKDITTKQQLLDAWDQTTEQINIYWPQIRPERFHEEVNLFGEYKFPAIQNIQYFIDNEIHHRGQGYVYLRTLDIQPPFFWERN